MRELLLAVAVCVALVGCDNKPEGGTAKPPADSKPGESKPADAKPAEGSKVAKHPWGSFKKGSFVKMKMVSEMEVAGNKMKTETTTTQTLKDLTADEAVIENEMVMANVPPQKSEIKIPLKAPEGGKAADGPKPKTGSEEIEVAGKKLKCDWTETETEVNGAKTVTRVYTNHDIPGFTAKMTSKSPTMNMTQEVVEFSSK
jgi:hypothetical protein